MIFSLKKVKTVQGFTLIELLVVISIIGILSTVVLSSLGSARTKARDARRTSDIQSIQIAMELYADSNGGAYPAALLSLEPTYISKVPKDPLSANGDYKYATCPTTGAITGYHIAAIIETAGSSLLGGDSDSAANTPVNCTGDFNGNATNCTGTTAASTDQCYDIKR